METKGRRQARTESICGSINAEDILASLRMVDEYAKPYRQLMDSREQGAHLVEMITGLSSNLERKSVEPIAVMLGLERHILQHFVGSSRWDWDLLRQLERREISEEIGIGDGALIFDGSSTPKKGTDTVGVARQWCGRLGKVDNCVVGVYAAYVGKSDLATIVDAQLYLPRDWITDTERRTATHIPSEVIYKSQPELAMDMLRKLAPELPLTWVMGDDEFGRVRDFRDLTASLGLKYLVDVPENTSFRRVKKSGRRGSKRWSASEFTKTRRVKDWTLLKLRDGEKGTSEVMAYQLPVVTQREGGKWVSETLVVIEMTDSSKRWYCLTNSDAELPELVRRASQRHRVEEVFAEAKGEVGLDHFEVRSWHGWHHHMTLCQLAHWFLCREKRRLGKKSTRPDDQHDPDGSRATPYWTTYARQRRLSRELPFTPQ